MASLATRRRVTVLVAARPNFVKLAPVVHWLGGDDRVAIRILHAGQHYDPALSGSFLDQLGMPQPDINLGAGSGTHAEQTARVLVGVERDLASDRPDALIVAGDVNSTLAGALAAAKLEIPIVHVEAGLRSRDWTMPEEINRVLTDRLSDLLLCTSADAVENLRAEGIEGRHVALVGNTMIDTLRRLVGAARAGGARDSLGLAKRGYALVTLHRPAVVDDDERLAAVLRALDDLASDVAVVLPLHPRVRERAHRLAHETAPRVRLLEPLHYLDFLALESDARLVVTDSGGVQEETSVLGVPCLTYRDSTERPVTVELGTNRVVGIDADALLAACRRELERTRDFTPADIPLWDGNAGERAADAIGALLLGQPGSRASSGGTVSALGSARSR
jgi:UDP-N-acetylglucosamine 2-epimerase (non-hydrolysing)